MIPYGHLCKASVSICEPEAYHNPSRWLSPPRATPPETITPSNESLRDYTSVRPLTGVDLTEKKTGGGDRCCRASTGLTTG